VVRFGGISRSPTGYQDIRREAPELRRHEGPPSLTPTRPGQDRHFSVATPSGRLARPGADRVPPAGIRRTARPNARTSSPANHPRQTPALPTRPTRRAQTPALPNQHAEGAGDQVFASHLSRWPPQHMVGPALLAEGSARPPRRRDDPPITPTTSAPPVTSAPPPPAHRRSPPRLSCARLRPEPAELAEPTEPTEIN
jgi:hypothetical protein